MIIEKRDGARVLFDGNKIVTAICEAAADVDGSISNEVIQLAQSITQSVYETLKANRRKLYGVEDIQDMVIDSLNKSPRPDIGGAYAAYRLIRARQRAGVAERDRMIKDKLSARNVVNANANLDENTFSGRMAEARDVITKDIALHETMSATAARNHEGNMIYTHDLNSYAVGMHNCLSLPLDDCLKNGVQVGETFLRPARSVNTAMQLVAVISQLQSQCQFGGVSATHIDWTMVPYVRRSFYKHFVDGMKWVERAEIHPEMAERDPEEVPIDDDSYKQYENAYAYAVEMTRKETYQAVEGMYHNLNSLQSRSGGQLPFTSINYGTCTLPEGRLVINALLDNSIKGVGKLHNVGGVEQGFTPIFPCGIFQLGKGINRKPGDPNYDLFQKALRSTAKRLYPNYANIDWSGNTGYDKNDPKTYFSTMGCRTANGFDANGLGQQKDGRGNICPVTIILPTLAMMAGGNVDKFLAILDDKIHEAKDQLIERFEHICAQPISAAKFMWENHMMAGFDGVTTRSALKHGTLVIGQLGLAEALQILVGCDHTEARGMELAKRIEALFQKRCKEFKAEEHTAPEDGSTYYLNFGVYYTPAENLCYTAMQKFKQEYGIIPNVSENDFFTNSTHVPVWKEISIFDKIDVEAQLTGYSSAGCITYVEIESSVTNNLPALEAIVNYAMDKDIPYFAINIPNDQCRDCGFTGDFNNCCPVCGSTDIKQLRRVTGYLSGDYRKFFNIGKQQEVEMRFRHSTKH